MKKITGTFIDEITCDIPSQNWGPAQWRRDLDIMKKSGIDTIILIRLGFRDMAAFPSEALNITDVPDLVTFFLEEAQRRDMNVFLGCYDSGKLGYKWLDYEPDIKINDKFIREIHKKFGGHPAFKGWYLSPETVDPSTEGACAIYSAYTELMKSLADMPLLISPGWPSYIYIEDSPKERHRKSVEGWDRLFSKAPHIDICAFQDGSCSYGNDFQHDFELELYYKETLDLCKKHNIELWANIETFSWKFPIKFPTMDWRYLKRRIEKASPYCEKLITFEFSHFLSPNSIFPASANLYDRYMEFVNNKNVF